MAEWNENKRVDVAWLVLAAFDRGYARCNLVECCRRLHLCQRLAGQLQLKGDQDPVSASPCLIMPGDCWQIASHPVLVAHTIITCGSGPPPLVILASVSAGQSASLLLGILNLSILLSTPSLSPSPPALRISCPSSSNPHLSPPTPPTSSSV